MSYNINYNNKDAIIEVKVVGNLDLSKMDEIVPEVTALAKKHDCLFWLSDYTDAVTKLTYSQIYELPKLINKAADDLSVIPCKIKRALVITNDKEHYSFAKTVFNNQGLTIETFNNYEEARCWLRSSEKLD